MKLKIILYAIISIAFQVLIGYWTGFGQGSLGLLLFVIIVEIDPDFSFRYLVSNVNTKVKGNPKRKEEK